MHGPTWGIVVGGMLGMTLALRLAQRGCRVTLLEAADHLGGLADAWSLPTAQGDVTWDRHYHVTLLSDSHLRGLLSELGLDDEIRWVETKTGFFTDGRLHSLSNSWEFLRFPPLRLWDKLRLALTIAYAARVKDGRRLERTPVADWLRRWSGRRTLEKIWLPLLRAKLGENYRHASAAFLWAIIARMYAARRTGLKKEMFGYVPGGYARVLQRLGDELRAQGVDVRLRHAVRRIQRPSCVGSPLTPTLSAEGRGSHGSGVRLEFADKPAAEFDRVVLTTPCPAILRMCPELSADEAQRLRQVRYQGIVCASLVLRRPLANYYVTNITDDGLPFTAVIEMTALVDPQALGGHSLIYLPKYLPSDDPAFERPDDELRAELLTGLRQMYPHFRADDVLAFRVSRVRHVLAISTLNYSDHLPPRQTSVPGLFIVNSAQIVNGTLNVNETMRLAEEAVPELLSAGGRRLQASDFGLQPAPAVVDESDSTHIEHHEACGAS